MIKSKDIFISIRNVVLLVLVMTLALHVDVQAQLKRDIPNSGVYLPAMQPYDEAKPKLSLGMKQSYSVNFLSYGGGLNNLNVFTNTFYFNYGSHLYGHVDVALLHSPFGSGLFSNSLNGNNGAKLIIQNAELTYNLGKNHSISIGYHYMPSTLYPYGLYGYGARNSYLR